MGSVTETLEELVDYLNNQGEKVGIVKVHLYRPFVTEELLKVIPNTVTKIAVLDRTKEPGAPGEPLYLDVRNAFQPYTNAPVIVGGRYGLGSKDVTPSHLKPVFDNLKMNSRKRFHHQHCRRRDRIIIAGRRRDHDRRSFDVRCKFWDWVLMEQLEPISQPSRSSETTPTCTPRDIFPTTQEVGRS